jgi:hypothetical protein
MTIIASPLCVTIVQGATLEEAWERRFYPYEVVEQCGVLVKKGSGEPAPDTDMVLEDYAGSVAEAKMVHPQTGAVIATLSTATGEIILDGAWFRLDMEYPATAAFVHGTEAPAWTSCTAEVFVTRPNGRREKQYEITFALDPKDTP